MWLVIIFLCALVVFLIGRKSRGLRILSLVMFILALICLVFFLKFKEQVPFDKIKSKTEFYNIEARYPLEDLDKEGIMKSFVENLVQQAEEERVENQVYNLDINFSSLESKSKQSVSYLFIIKTYTNEDDINERVKTFTFNQKGLIELDDFIQELGFNNNQDDELLLSRLLLKNSLLYPEVFSDFNLTAKGLGFTCLKDDAVSMDYEKCDTWPFAANLENFVISDDGVIFFFDKCSVSDCSLGPVGIFIDNGELNPLLWKEVDNFDLLQSKEWFWVETRYSNDEIVKSKKENAFSIVLNSDGTVSFKTDCNNAAGFYEIDNYEIKFSQIAHDQLFCEGSQEEEFISMISEVDSFNFDDSGGLVLGIKDNLGSMIFK